MLNTTRNKLKSYYGWQIKFTTTRNKLKSYYGWQIKFNHVESLESQLNPLKLIDFASIR